MPKYSELHSKYQNTISVGAYIKLNLHYNTNFIIHTCKQTVLRASRITVPPFLKKSALQTLKLTDNLHL